MFLSSLTMQYLKVDGKKPLTWKTSGLNGQIPVLSKLFQRLQLFHMLHHAVG
jgi:hypothetical protein